LGAAAAATVPAVAAQSPVKPEWRPTRHTQDDWFDEIPGMHRLVFDTTESNGLSSALLYSTNFYIANQSGYGLQNADLAVVIVVRHFSTPFAYNDAIWSKYGATISNFINPGKDPAKSNAYLRQLTAAVGRGTHLGVCAMATSAIADAIAKANNSTSDEIVKEISANLLPNSHLVPAGIVAVGRAQERGYAFVHAG
jgi:hypothetical protein